MIGMLRMRNEGRESTFEMAVILLVEDEPHLLEGLAELLRYAEYSTLTANNGASGVALAIAQQPDLILCDMMIPEIDGFGVLARVRAEASIAHTPFFFMSAKTDAETQALAIQRGADGFIAKPFLFDELLQLLEDNLPR